jgi:glycosyltransferase involved in cell wall biosynthesis
MLVHYFRQGNFDLSVFDITSKLELVATNSSFVKRSLEYVYILPRIFAAIFQSQQGILYFTIAQGPLGFIRDFFVIAFASLFQYRIVLHLKGGNYDGFYQSQNILLQSLIRFTLSKADAMVVLSDSLRKMFDFMPNFSQKIVTVANGLPISEVQEHTTKKHKNTALRILFLSNLIQSKGYADVIDAVIQCNYQLNCDVELHLCGRILSDSDDTAPVPSAEELRRQIKSKDPLGKIHFVGVVTGDAKIQELNEADVFILPTKYRNEGLPVSMIEAMAYGCVLIGTSFRAIPDMLHDGENGFVVPYGDTRAMAETIKKIVDSPETLKKMSAKSVEIYKTKFTQEAHLKSLSEVILGDHLKS